MQTDSRRSRHGVRETSAYRAWSRVPSHERYARGQRSRANVAKLLAWARLGQRLIERTTRSLRLTDAGGAYYHRIAPALDAMHEAERTLEDLKTQPSGRLRVTATLEGGQFLLAPLFAEYMQRYPGVELEVVLADRHVDLVAEGFDLAVRSGTLADSSLIAKRLPAHGSMRLYASAEYLKARGEPRHPEQLSEHDCLVMSSQSNTSVWHFRVQRKLAPFAVSARALANSFVVLRELAAVGLGIARMPENIGRAQPGGKLRTVLDAYAPPPVPIHVVYPSARHLSSKVRGLVELLEQRLGA